MGSPAGNYYDATAQPFKRQPPLRDEVRCDVVVIGGGFTGVAAALAAAEAGAKVVLLEAETIAHGASGRNGGQLIPGLRWTGSHLKAAFGLDRARAVHDVALQAVDRVRARVRRHGIACDLKAGHLEAAWKPAHFVEQQREAELLARDFGRKNLEIVAPTEMQRHVSTDAYHGGLYDPDGGHFHPLNYLLGLATAAREAGATLHEQSRVRTLTQNGGVRAETAGGHVIAERAILATDAWTGDLQPRLGRFTVPLMNYNVATATLGERAAQLLPSDAAVADSRFVLNYYRMSADGRLIFGGGERYRSEPPSDIAGFVGPFLERIFPQLAGVPIDFGWGGIVSVTANRLPHLGQNGAILFAHGFSGHGALLTTLAGELCAEALHRDSSGFDLLAGLPHRPFPGGPLLARPLATMGLLYYAMKDRL
ncbi:MAG TPA: FAD-binding oxidoreductase [Sphingomicrobium sp.]|jgi:gamma-glutamylputrescine oxidase|nr:FAD-binding oxidoreductase [Sphingomicrobium sp.]